MSGLVTFLMCALGFLLGFTLDGRALIIALVALVCAYVLGVIHASLLP